MTKTVTNGEVWLWVLIKRVMCLRKKLKSEVLYLPWTCHVCFLYCVCDLS